jgi:azobenzene reductase
MSTSPLQICLVGGSAEYPSRILACLEFLAQHLHMSGSRTQVWDLAQDPLPLLDMRAHSDSSRPGSEKVKKLAALAEQADAFVWGSPVYHDSFSGILKNALDSLSLQQFLHKPVALVSCGNNERTSSQPCDHLRIVARSLHAHPIPTQLVTLPADFTRDQDRYLLANTELQERAIHMAEELTSYAFALRLVRADMNSWFREAQKNGYSLVR